MSELIDRQAALDALCDACTLASVKSECIFKNLESCMDHNAILDVPAVEEQWILCSERLPKNRLCVLVTYKYEYGLIDHGITWYGEAEKKWNTSRDVIAWMPLPEPYKGEQE